MRAVRVGAPAVLVGVAFLAMLMALAYCRGADASLIADPGAAVRFGLPTARLLVNLGAAGMIGSLVLVCFALPPADGAQQGAGGRTQQGGEARTEAASALHVAAASAAVMTIASAVTGFLSYLSVAGIPVSTSQRFSDGLSDFVTSVPLGRAWLTSTVLAAVVTVLCFAVRSATLLVFVTALALLTLLPMAQQGHAADAAGHDDAVTALGLHLVFAAVWVGGLLTVAVLHRALPRQRLTVVIERYSTVAIVCFTVVAASGCVGAALRIGTPQGLLTPYGVLVLVKASALVVLGVFGGIHRRWLVHRPRSGAGPTPAPGAFWWFVTAELAFMGIASGVAVALARTAAPVSDTLRGAPTPAQILTGAPLPPPATLARYVSSINVDLLWALACAFGLFFYLAGVRRLHRRGEHWPALRTVSWVAGMLLLLATTNGGLNVYGTYLFSAHITADLVLAVLVPLLLVPAAPVTLGLRAIRPRTDASRGPREWIRAALHSPVRGYLSHPLVAAVLAVGSLWVIYHSPILSWATTDRVGHECIALYLLITGSLFVQSLIGRDPAGHRAPRRVLLLLLAALAVAFAGFGLGIATSTGLMLADWYGAMGRTWGQSALGDQRTGGLLALAIGEAAVLILALTVLARSRTLSRRP